MLGFVLFLIAYVLFFPLTIINFVIVALKGKGKGYFMSTAINVDKFANREFRTLWNLTLRTESGYEFGDFRETISSALGKNKRDNTLTKTGKVLADFLDFLDKNHCIKSIQNFKD